MSKIKERRELLCIIQCLNNCITTLFIELNWKLKLHANEITALTNSNKQRTIIPIFVTNEQQLLLFNNPNHLSIVSGSDCKL